MKSIPLIHKYVLEQLKKNNALTVDILLSAIEETCSKETLEQILCVLIREQKENIKKNTTTVTGKISIFHKNATKIETKARVIEALRDILHLEYCDAEVYVNWSCTKHIAIPFNKIEVCEINELIKQLQLLDYEVISDAIYD